MVLEVIVVFPGVVLVVCSRNTDRSSTGPSGEVKDLHDRSRTSRGISRMSRSSSKRPFKTVLIGVC